MRRFRRLGMLPLFLLLLTGYTPQPTLFYAYTWVEARSREKHGPIRHLMVISNVFTYCTPSHRFEKIVDDQRPFYAQIATQNLGEDAYYHVYYSSGNPKQQIAEESRSRKIAWAEREGHTVEMTTYNVAMYAPAADCKPW